MYALTKARFLVLTALLKFPMHPYAIRQEIIRLTGHEIILPHSTIRAAFDSLLKIGWIEECRDNAYAWLVARRSVPYELTDSGHHRARRELSMYYEIVVKSYKLLN